MLYFDCKITQNSNNLQHFDNSAIIFCLKYKKWLTLQL